MKSSNRILKQFNWRFLLVRIVVNAFALAGAAAFTPGVYFVDQTIRNWLLMAVMLGVLNALLKPLLQFLTLQFIFVTYGLVVVLVNALILWLLALIFPGRFAVESIWWLLLAGLILGLLSSFLESLLGLSMPIVPDVPAGLRQQVEERARQAQWLTTASSPASGSPAASALERSKKPAPDLNLAGAAMTESSAPEADQEPPAPEKVDVSRIEAAPDSPSPVDVDARPVDSGPELPSPVESDTAPVDTAPGSLAPAEIESQSIAPVDSPPDVAASIDDSLLASEPREEPKEDQP